MTRVARFFVLCLLVVFVAGALAGGASAGKPLIRGGKKTTQPTEPAPAPSEPAPAPTEPAADPAPAPTGWTLLKEWTFSTDPRSEFNVYDGFKTSANAVGGIYKRSNVRWVSGELLIVGDGINGGGLNVRLSRTYGRWDIRARMEAGSGAGPALLLWPQSDVWPADGEIDVMESPLGDHNAVHMTTHWGVWPQHYQDGRSFPIDAKQWHTYSVEWEAGVVRYLIDNNVMFTKSGLPGWDIPSKPMSLAMQVDGPNGWIPRRDSSSPAEMTFHIDNVRVSTR